MSKISKRKILKRILITVLTVITALAAGTYCIFNFYIKPKYSQQIINAVTEVMQDEELAEEISKITEDEQLQADIENAVSDEQINADVAAAVQSAQQNNQSGKKTQSGDGGQTQSAEGPAKEQGEQSGAAKNTSSEKKTSSKNKSLVERAREEATPAEFAAGMRIAGKLDVGYLTGLMKGGLTPEEKQAAKAHIKSRLTGAEISKMFALYSKYSYLLN